MNEIEDLIANKDFSTAKNIIEERLKNNENDINLLKNLGLCLVNLEDKKNALAVFLKILDLNQDDATSYFYAASLYKEMSDTDKAIEYYKKVIELRENYLDAYKNLASIYISKKRVKEADDIIAKAYSILDKDSEDYLIPYLYANTQILMQNTDNAEKLLQEALNINPKHVQSLNTLGCLLMSKNDFDKALEYYQKSLEIEPDNPVTHYNLATFYLVKQDFNKAKKHFKITYNAMPTKQHLSQLALAQFKDNDFNAAAISYQKLCTKNPHSLTFRYNYAVCLYQQKSYKQAISLLLPIAQQNPKSAKIAHQLALCFEAIGQIRNAALIYEKIIKIGKIPPEIYLDYANLLIIDNDNQKAESVLKKLIQINPNHALAHKDLGVLYLIERLFSEAQEEFETAFKLEPENPTIIFEYANYFQAISEFTKADELYSKAVKLMPHNPNILLMYGLNRMKVNDFEQAKLYLQRVLAYQPKNHTALFNLGQICYIEKNFETAKEFLTDAYLINNDIETTNLYALTYMELNDIHNAKILFNRLNHEIPNNPAILTKLAKAEILDNNPEMAKKYLEQAVAIFPEMEEANEILKNLT